MIAVVLVGGEGTRLRPLTYTTPKPLLPIGNQPLIERQLTWLARHGVHEAVLSLGYLPDAFEAQFPEGRFGDLTIRYAVEPSPLGTAGAIRFAAQGIDERFVVCNGDVLTTLDLSSLVLAHDERRAEATIHLSHVDHPSAFGVVPTRADGEVLAFVEKPPADAAPTRWINAGTYVLEPTVLDEIPPRIAVSIERETFPRMLDRPGRVYAMKSDAYWLDIGTPEKYLEVHADLLDRALGVLPASDAVERAPGVWVQGHADVADGVLKAPVLVGRGARVEEGAHVEASTLGTGSVVERGAEVYRSVILDAARVGPSAEVSDSVMGPGSMLEADVVATDQTVVGASAVVSAGSVVSGGRIHVPRR